MTAAQTAGSLAIDQPTLVSTHDELVFSFDREIQPARQVIAHLPADHLDWRPHAKSRPLGELAWHMASLPLVVPTVIQNESQQRPDIQWPACPATTAAMLAGFDANVAAGRALVAKMDDATLALPFRMMNGEHVMFAMTRGRFAAWGLLAHLIHHRAQLGLYFRLLDLPVPAMIGPSADENPFAPKP